MRSKVFLIFLSISLTLSSLSFVNAYRSYNATHAKLNDINIEQYEISKIKISANENSVDNSSVKTEKTTKAEKTSASSKTDVEQINIIFDDMFKVENSKLILSFDNKMFSFYVDGRHIVDIDSSKASSLIDNKIIVEIKHNDEEVPDQTCVTLDEDGNMVIIGKQAINKNYSVTVCCPTSEEAKNSDESTIKKIMSSAKQESMLLPVSLAGQTFSDWAKIIIITPDSLTLNKNKDSIYVYNLDIDYEGAGFEETTIGKTKVLESKITDEETGYSPYIVEIANESFEFLSSKHEILEKIFVK